MAQKPGMLMSEGRRKWTSQLKENSKLDLPPPLHRLALFMPSTNWVLPAHTGEGGHFLFSLPFKRLSLPETPSQMDAEINNILLAVCACLSLTHTVNHHSTFGQLT